MKVKQSENKRHEILKKAVDEYNYDVQGRMVYKGRLAQQKTFSEFKKQAGNFSFNEANLKINEDMEMLNELMELYEIDQSEPNYWFSLAYALANEHVPCFRFKGHKKKGGRPKKWNEKTNGILVNQVKKIIAEHSSFKATDACRFLVKNGYYEANPKGLYTRYLEAKKRIKEKQQLRELNK